MSVNYPFPSKRMGNELNPKLVILLENNGGNPRYIKWNSDYSMNMDGVYKDSGIPFSIVKEYDRWWHDMSERWASKFKDDEVLALEYYPYATEKTIKCNEIYPRQNDTQWNQYARDSLIENIELLRNAMNNRAAIFIYYSANGNWYEKVPELKQYKGKISHVDTGTYPSLIKKRFDSFISSI